MDYGKTLHLPETEFPMRGNLPKREPELLAFWKDNDIYHKRLKKREGAKKFILHDGPPYANGKLHIGHALNKVLKDIILKYKTQQGFYTKYVPGWDTHGLPIEHAVIKETGLNRHEMSPLDLRKRCHDYALARASLGYRFQDARQSLEILPFYQAQFSGSRQFPDKAPRQKRVLPYMLGHAVGVLLNGSSRRNGRVSYRWKECGRISARRNARVIKTGRCGMRLHRCRTASVRSISCSQATAGAACTRVTAWWAAAPILRAMCGIACRPAGWRNGRLWAT